MKNSIIISLTILLAILCGSVYASGDPEAGKNKIATCTACHGADGNSPSPLWPKIAGQNEKYLLAQLQAFKQGAAGARRSVDSGQMYAMVATLSEQDLQDIAAYYVAQKIKVGTADDKLAARGKDLYRGGNLDTRLPACAACHGPSGKGNPAAGFPAVAGQHAEYSYKQLRAFHSGERVGDPNSMMREVVRKMSDEEMRAVAEYMQGLY